MEKIKVVIATLLAKKGIELSVKGCLWPTVLLSLNLFLMIAIGCLISFWLIPDYLHTLTGHDERVTVPSVISQDADDAVAMIAERGLVPMIVDTVFSDSHAPGTVIEQLPEGNLPVKPGRNVYLTINSYTTQNFTFPEVLQLSSRQARSELDDQFFVVDSVRYEPYEFDDLVIDVVSSKDDKPMEAGKEYPKRTHVVLVVGSTQVDIKAENDETESSFFE